MTRVAQVGLVAVAVAVAIGCGGSGSDNAQRPEAQEVVEELQSLRKGEIVIKGTSPRAYGPYTLKPGGYVLTFEQEGADPSRIVVALESKPGSRRKPYALVVNSTDRMGKRAVGITGRLYVRVVSAEAEYELHLLPKGR
jgi:hypothetical protein